VSLYNVTIGSRTAASKPFNTLSAAYGVWAEKDLGVDANFPVSMNVNSPYLNTTGTTLDANNGASQTNPPKYHYSFGVTMLSTPTGGSVNTYLSLSTIHDDSFVSYVNSNSSLFAFVNLLDEPTGYVYLECRDSASAANTTWTQQRVSEATNGISWQSANSGRSSGQCRVLRDNVARTQIVDWTGLSVQNNAFFTFVISGSQVATVKDVFPVKVTIQKSASQTGSPASTVAVSFALMALLAILAFATPALF